MSYKVKQKFWPVFSRWFNRKELYSNRLQKNIMKYPSLPFSNKEEKLQPYEPIKFENSLF